MFWRALSLRSKILILTLAGLACMGVFSYLLLKQSFSSRQELAQEDVKAKAVSASHGIAALFRERYMDVQSFATNSVFLGQNKEAIIQVLNNHVENYGFYDAIVFVDAEGKFVASNSKTFDGRAIDQKNLEGRSFGETPWFGRAVKGQFLEDNSKGLTGSVVEDIQVDPLSSALLGNTQFGMSFSRAVVLPDGKLVGVVTARSSLRFIESELRGIFNLFQSAGLRTGQALLINREGWLLAEVSSETVTERNEVKRNPDKVLRWNLATQQGQMAAAEAVAGRAGATLEIDRVARVKRIWGYNPLRDSRFLDQLGWSVVVSTAHDEVLAEVISQRRWFIFGFIVLLIVFGLFGQGIGGLMSRELLEQTHRLKEEASRIGEKVDGLGHVLYKASQSGSENHATVLTVSATVKAIYGQTEDCEKTLSETVHLAKELKNKASLADHAVQRVGVETALARTSAEQLSDFEKAIEEMGSKVSGFSELIFRLHLAGTNVQIEAARAGVQGRGVTALGHDLGVLSEQMDLLFREVSEGFAVLKERLQFLSGSIRRSVNDAAMLLTDARSNVTDFPVAFSNLSSSLEVIENALTFREAALRSAFDSMLLADVSGTRTTHVYGDLKRGLQDWQDQSERIADLIQDLNSAIKGERVRGRARRRSSAFADAASVFKRSVEISPDQARADVVDRLAQKMRPRLVVKAQESEPEVNDIGVDEGPSRHVG